MINAANYDKTATLKNGIEVKVRSIRPDDKNRLIEALKYIET
jgi:hypothetical protein